MEFYTEDQVWAFTNENEIWERGYIEHNNGDNTYEIKFLSNSGAEYTNTIDVSNITTVFPKYDNELFLKLNDNADRKDDIPAQYIRKSYPYIFADGLWFYKGYNKKNDLVTFSE